MTDTGRHQTEADTNLEHWQRKPLLRQIYADFYRQIAAQMRNQGEGVCVEIGSGIGNIKEVIPHCLRTDIFDQPWLDAVENAYALSYQDQSVDNLVLFDVFHHLKYPGTALEEFQRVLKPGGRLIIFEPCVSLLGRLVYGAMHPEPLGLKQPIEWQAPSGWNSSELEYYAAQGNAWRLFIRRQSTGSLDHWTVRRVRRLAAISYVASGGYSGPQLYPDSWLPLLRLIDKACNAIPSLFATRLMVVLEKN